MWFELGSWISGSSDAASDPEDFTKKRFTGRPSTAASPPSRTRACWRSTAASCLPSREWAPGTSSSSSCTSRWKSGTLPHLRARDILTIVHYNCKCSALPQTGDIILLLPHKPTNQGSPSFTVAATNQVLECSPRRADMNLCFTLSQICCCCSLLLMYLNGLREFMQWSLKRNYDKWWYRSFKEIMRNLGFRCIFLSRSPKVCCHNSEINFLSKIVKIIFNEDRLSVLIFFDDEGLKLKLGLLIQPGAGFINVTKCTEA